MISGTTTTPSTARTHVRLAWLVAITISLNGLSVGGPPTKLSEIGYSCGMDRSEAGRVLDRVIQVFVLGIFLAPVVLYFLLLLLAFSFFLVSRVLPCDWLLHEAFNGFNPRCNPNYAD